ncbi:MAG: transposase [Cyanobacteriota bacterium]|nr:transposase [Cyanobacteriota bacterium]
MSLKNSSGSHRKYDPAFKDDVVKMIASGRSVGEVSKALGISASLIHRWNKSSLNRFSNPAIGELDSAGSASSLALENERLKAELRRTEQERDILKKALGIFSRTP